MGFSISVSKRYWLPYFGSYNCGFCWQGLRISGFAWRWPYQPKSTFCFPKQSPGMKFPFPSLFWDFEVFLGNQVICFCGFSNFWFDFVDFTGSGSEFDYYRLLYAWNDRLWALKKDQGGLSVDFILLFLLISYLLILQPTHFFIAFSHSLRKSYGTHIKLNNILETKRVQL